MQFQYNIFGLQWIFTGDYIIQHCASLCILDGATTKILYYIIVLVLLNTFDMVRIILKVLEFVIE